MMTESDIKEIQNDIYKFIKEKDLPLLPTGYKKLFLKYAKKKGFSEEDCLNVDKELAFEKLLIKSSSIKNKKIDKTYSDMSKNTEELVILLDKGTSDLTVSIKDAEDSLDYSVNRKLADKMKRFMNQYSEMTNKIKDIRENIVKIKGALETLDDLSIQDDISMLGNCKFFEMTIDGEKYTLKRYKIPISVAVLRMMNLQDVKSKYGNAAAVSVIKSLANIVYENTRASDVSCRCDDNEFRIILHNTDIQKADLFTQKIRYILNRVTFQKGEDKFKVKILYNTTFVDINDTMEKITRRLEANLK